jgi:hypothetical protein
VTFDAQQLVVAHKAISLDESKLLTKDIPKYFSSIYMQTSQDQIGDLSITASYQSVSCSVIAKEFDENQMIDTNYLCPDLQGENMIL